LAFVQIFSNLSLCTKRVATFSVALFTAAFSWGASPFTAWAAAGGSPCDCSQAASSAVTRLPSTRTSTAWTMRLRAASSIAGLEASGPTVST